MQQHRVGIYQFTFNEQSQRKHREACCMKKNPFIICNIIIYDTILYRNIILKMCLFFE